MTKIEIDLCDEDFIPAAPFFSSFICEKAKKAYREAKEKEIKVGDWVYGTASKTVFCAEVEYGPAVRKGVIKLPQNLQDGLNEFIKNQEKS